MIWFDHIRENLPARIAKEEMTAIEGVTLYRRGGMRLPTCGIARQEFIVGAPGVYVNPLMVENGRRAIILGDSEIMTHDGQKELRYLGHRKRIHLGWVQATHGIDERVVGQGATRIHDGHAGRTRPRTMHARKANATTLGTIRKLEDDERTHGMPKEMRSRMVLPHLVENEVGKMREVARACVFQHARMTGILNGVKRYTMCNRSTLPYVEPRCVSASVREAKHARATAVAANSLDARTSRKQAIATCH